MKKTLLQALNLENLHNENPKHTKGTQRNWGLELPPSACGTTQGTTGIGTEGGTLAMYQKTK